MQQCPFKEFVSGMGEVNREVERSSLSASPKKNFSSVSMRLSIVRALKDRFITYHCLSLEPVEI